MNPEMTRVQMMQRMAEFATPIQNLAQQNTLIHHIAECYVRGEIITREEALCRMIIELAKEKQESK